MIEGPITSVTSQREPRTVDGCNERFHASTKLITGCVPDIKYQITGALDAFKQDERRRVSRGYSK